MPDVGRPTETVTIMMTDVEGSTALRLARGDLVADEILRSHADIVRRQLRRHGGQERQFLGDGFLLFFPSPVAALGCAVDIQRELDERNAAQPEHTVRVRIGIHVGEVSSGVGELYGQAVHAAARVMSEAAGGQILVSAGVRDRFERGVRDPAATYRFLDIGLFWLKGFPERWRLYEVVPEGAPSGQRASASAPVLTALVERDAERADLRRAVDEARAGRGRLVLVAGEPGVGKSRLVAEITHEAEARGMQVLTGHCVQMDGAAPYLPYVEMIEQAVSSPRSPLALREALSGVAPELARIAPSLRRALPDIAAPMELPPELARRYVWNSVAEFLTRGAQQQPLLLVLEDLHWADESTVLLTEYLAPLLRELPVLVLGTYRDGEVGFSHPLARVISQLVRRRLLDRMTLERLSAAGVQAMVQELAGQAVPERLVRVIDDETEGNPFFVEEVYLHLAESGMLYDENGVMRRDLAIDEASLPEGIRLVLGERLERLSPGTRSTLTAAAILGRVFPPDLVGPVADEDSDSVFDAFDEAERARLITPTSGQQLSFQHELIRQTLLAELSTVRRARLHLRAADAIENRYLDEVDAHAGDMAHHLSLAGRLADPARVVRYLSIAGQRAYDAAAFEDAVTHYRRALPLVSPSSRETRAELLEQLALASRSAGHWNEALSMMNDALDLDEELGRSAAIGRLSWAMVEQLTWTARVPDAVQVCRRALTLLGDVTSADRARLTGMLAWAVSLSGDHATAIGMFEQARALAGQVGDERATADVLHLQTIHHFAHVEFDEGVRVGLRAAQVFDTKGDLWNLCSVQSFVVFQDGMAGGRVQARTLADDAMGIARRLGHLGATFMLLDDRARERLAVADFASVEALGLEIIEICERGGGLPWRYVGHGFVGLAAHLRGDAGRAEEELRRAVALEPPGAFAGQAVSLLARHLAHAGGGGEVLALFESARSTFDSAERLTIGAWNCMLALVEALYLTGHRHEAASLSPLVERQLAMGPDWESLDCRLVRTCAGVAAAAGRRWDDAHDHFAAAEERARVTSNDLERVELRRLRARMLLDRARPGDRVAAAELLTEARSDYLRLGMPGYAAEVEATLIEAQSWRGG